MRIIVEGPDGAGKTTLVEAIEKRLGLTRQPRAVDKQAKAMTPIDEWVDKDLNLEKDQPRQVRLYDRHAVISGPIYSPILHSGFMSNPWDLQDWTRLVICRFWNQDSIVIFCLPDAQTVLSNVQKTITEQPPALQSLDAFHQMYWSYWLVAHHLMLNPHGHFVYTYDYTREGAMERLLTHLDDLDAVEKWERP